jgi:hypothetical protein
MRKPNKKNYKQVQEIPFTISATIDEAPLLDNLVENLAHRRIDLGYGREAVPSDLQAIETSSLEVFVSGNLSMSGQDYADKIAFVGCFLFTCTKATGEEYALSWCSSLS